MVNKIDLLNDNEFKELIDRNHSISDVLRELKYSVEGNSWGYRIIKDRMDELNLNFKKKKIISTIPKQAIPLNEILKEESNYSRTKLKSRLFKEGLKEYKCEICGISEWQGKPISLQLHHINGINNDNRLSNLQILCPNCHSQTDNFGTKGKGMEIVRKCERLPKEDIDKIMNTVREVGIVEARKTLPYRNALINYVVRNHRDTIVMIDLKGNETEFSTIVEAAMYLAKIVGKDVENIRNSISKCCSGRQKTTSGGYKFYRRSAEE